MSHHQLPARTPQVVLSRSLEHLANAQSFHVEGQSSLGNMIFWRADYASPRYLIQEPLALNGCASPEGTAVCGWQGFSSESASYVRKCEQICTDWTPIDPGAGFAVSGLDAIALPSWPIALLSSAQAQSIAEAGSATKIMVTFDEAQINSSAERVTLGGSSEGISCSVEGQVSLFPDTMTATPSATCTTIAAMDLRAEATVTVSTADYSLVALSTQILGADGTLDDVSLQFTGVGGTTVTETPPP